MRFDVKAALAEVRAAGLGVSPAPKGQVAQIARIARSLPADPKNASDAIARRPSAPATQKPGCMVRLSWSGEWVSADRFAAMSDRERYGPRGRLWCGRCRQERDHETALRCLDGERCQ